jgi:hypothetical protein
MPTIPTQPETAPAVSDRTDALAHPDVIAVEPIAPVVSEAPVVTVVPEAPVVKSVVRDQESKSVKAEKPAKSKDEPEFDIETPAGWANRIGRPAVADPSVPVHHV